MHMHGVRGSVCATILIISACDISMLILCSLKADVAASCMNS